MNAAITLNNTANAAITDAVKADGAALGKWVKVTDALIALGVTPALLKADKANTELRDQVKARIVLGFTPANQALLAKESKSLDDVQKMHRKEVQQEIGSKLGKIERHLRDRLEPKKPVELDADGKPVVESDKTEIQKIQQALDSVIKNTFSLGGRAN